MDEFYLNYHIAFPQAGEAREVYAAMRQREQRLGYDPIKRLIGQLKRK